MRRYHNRWASRVLPLLHSLYSLGIILVCLFVVNGALDASTIEKKQRVAGQVFYAPGAEWAVFEQPFWKHHVIFKLVSSTDSHFIHRPKVAVDEQDKPRLLTIGIVKVGDERILENFNRIAQNEDIRVTAENAATYARFFTNVHLVSYHSDYLIDQNFMRKFLELHRNSEEAQQLETEIVRQGGRLWLLTSQIRRSEPPLLYGTPRQVP